MSHWNQHSETILEIMVPPATGDDEARTKGYHAAALIKLMGNVGLLEYERKPSSAIGSSTYTPTFTLAHNIDDKLMYLCLDGMSINRHRSFKKYMSTLPIGFTKAYEQSWIFKTALERVVQPKYPIMDESITNSGRC